MKFLECLCHLAARGVIKFTDKAFHAYYKYDIGNDNMKIFTYSGRNDSASWSNANATYATFMLNNPDGFELSHPEKKKVKKTFYKPIYIRVNGDLVIPPVLLQSKESALEYCKPTIPLRIEEVIEEIEE